MRMRLRAWILVGAGLLAVGAGPAYGADTSSADSAAGSVQYTVQDLGTLGGTRSKATAIDGNTVVGSSQTSGNAAEHAFAYDLRRHTMTDLGTLGDSSRATGVEGATSSGSQTSPPTARRTDSPTTSAPAGSSTSARSAAAPPTSPAWAVTPWWARLRSPATWSPTRSRTA